MAVAGQSGNGGSLKKSRADYDQRLSHEIAIIQQMKFSDIFLIVWDFIRYARENSIPWGRARFRRGRAGGLFHGYYQYRSVTKRASVRALP